MWVFLAVASAVFLGVYDIFKKSALNGNAVLPVLFLSSATGAFIMVWPTILSSANIISSGSLFYVPPIGLDAHLMILLKSAIVVSAWTLSFFAIKHLPITIVSPIRSTSPLWTLIGALIIYGERLNALQWSGMITTLAFFYMFSTAGKREGIHFGSNKYIWYAVASTVLNATSGLYDKYLLQVVDRMAVQSYFSFYQVVLLAPILAFYWYPLRKKFTLFQFRWAIPFIGLFLIIADFLYFYAVHEPEALISVIAALRRASVLVAFVLGALIFKEQNLSRKGIFLLGILAGILLLIFGR